MCRTTEFFLNKFQGPGRGCFGQILLLRVIRYDDDVLNQRAPEKVLQAKSHVPKPNIIQAPVRLKIESPCTLSYNNGRRHNYLPSKADY